MTDAAPAAAPEQPVRRDHLTRFSSSNQPVKTGRSRGFKDRITHDFLRALSEDFAENGAAAIKTVRADDPAKYLQLCASLVPKEIELRVDDQDTERVERAIEMLNAIIDARPKDITADVEIVNGADD